MGLHQDGMARETNGKAISATEVKSQEYRKRIKGTYGDMLDLAQSLSFAVQHSGSAVLSVEE